MRHIQDQSTENTVIDDLDEEKETQEEEIEVQFHQLNTLDIDDKNRSRIFEPAPYPYRDLLKLYELIVAANISQENKTAFLIRLNKLNQPVMPYNDQAIKLTCLIEDQLDELADCSYSFGK